MNLRRGEMHINCCRHIAILYVFYTLSFLQLLVLSKTLNWAHQNSPKHAIWDRKKTTNKILTEKHKST